MKKVIIAIACLVGFSGCTGAITGIKYTPETIATAYGTAKVVYSDVRHVVYEVQEEQERIDKEGLGKKK